MHYNEQIQVYYEKRNFKLGCKWYWHSLTDFFYSEKRWASQNLGEELYFSENLTLYLMLKQAVSEINFCLIEYYWKKELDEALS